MIDDLEFWRLDSVAKAKTLAEDIDRLVSVLPGVPSVNEKDMDQLTAR
jgi:hypothetical protein